MKNIRPVICVVTILKDSAFIYGNFYIGQRLHGPMASFASALKIPKRTRKKIIVTIKDVCILSYYLKIYIYNFSSPS